MERAHRAKLQRRFKPHLKRARVICLDIPDDDTFMQPELVAVLQKKVTPHLRSFSPCGRRITSCSPALRPSVPAAP